MLLKYDEVKEHLQTRLCDPKRNAELLKTLVTTDYGIYTAYYAILLDEDSSKTGLITSVLIGDKVLEYWNITPEQLSIDAGKADLARGAWMFDIHANLIRNDFRFDEDLNILGKKIDISHHPAPIFTLTNRLMANGAALILQPSIRYLVGETLQSDFYAIPSSIHENMIVPDTGVLSPDDILEIVISINGSPDIISPEDVLSDDILWCSRDGDKVLPIKHKEEE